MHSTVRARHHDALVDAAVVLMEERGREFSVDELAEGAGVSRRTVFNHFSSLDDVAVEVGVRELNRFRAEFDATAAQLSPSDRGDHLGEIEATFDRMDLVPAIARLTRMLATETPAGRELLERSLAAVIPGIMADARTRAPGVDPLASDLLAAHLTAGLVVLQQHWAKRTGAVVDDASRRVWSDLVHTLIDRMRNGHPSPEAHHG